MSFFVQPTTAPSPKTGNIHTIALLLSAAFIFMAVAQLFKYEEFPDVIAALWLTGGMATAHILAAWIVIFEVFSLPFLLRMRLSPAMRVISMVAGWLVVGIWIAITLWENLTTTIVANSGLLGAVVSLPVGWGNVLLCVALGVLVAWVSWGMWPFGARTHK